MNDKDFQKIVTGRLGDDVYERIREDGASESAA